MPAIDDPSIPLQAAIIASLKGMSSAAGQRVYDAVPAEADRKAATGAAWPYIHISAFQVVSEKVECLQGAEVFVTIDAFSITVGKGEVKLLGKNIIAALDDADLSGPDLAVNSCLFEDANYIDDPDGTTSHGIFTFHILTD